MKVTMHDIKDLLIIACIAIVTIVAALYQNWAFVGTSVTGAFALLNLKGNSNEQPESNQETKSAASV